MTYTTIQNWSPNVYNLVTKRARVEAEGHMEWIDGNIGSKLTMKYPSVYLVGPKATGEVLSVAYAGAGQHQDAGAKMIHAAPETTSKIVSKSISKDGGITTYRGLVRVDEGAHGCKSHVQCDALILDEDSESRTLPYMEVGERDAQIGHEATVSKVADEQLFYLMSRGLSEEQAMGMVVNGFIEPITRTLPMEYAVEWSRLIELQMEGSRRLIARRRRHVGGREPGVSGDAVVAARPAMATSRQPVDVGRVERLAPAPACGTRSGRRSCRRRPAGRGRRAARRAPGPARRSSGSAAGARR